MKKNYRTGPRHSPPGMPPEGFPENHVPQNPEEASYMGVDWVGIVETPDKPSLNRQGTNQQPKHTAPKASGIRHRRWGEL